MKIRARFNLIFTLLATSILLFFAASVFWISKKTRENEFNTILENEAHLKANLFIEANLSPTALQQIYTNQNKNQNTIHIAIYNDALKELYSDYPTSASSDSLQQLLEKIKLDKNLKSRKNITQTIGMQIKLGEKDFLILASGKDTYGQEKLNELLYILLFTAIIAIIILYILGIYFSKRVLQPVKEMTKEINKITAAHLDLRLKPLKYKDELNDLGAIFNQMLDRLENSFDSQKEFVAHISHELRTPLAAMITDLELALNHKQSEKEYRDTIERSLSDAQKIVKLSNNLLDLAKANYDPQEIGYTSLRIDEILLEAYQEIQSGTSACSVQMEFATDSTDENLMTVMGNPYLLKVACKNLIENACKFSANHHCFISIGFNKKMVKVDFIDTGIGITEEELEQILIPFYRGNSQADYDGYGIGLPLTHKILLQHNGKLKITTTPGKGSKFTIYIPHLASGY